MNRQTERGPRTPPQDGKERPIGEPTPDISVIITAWNAEATIERAVRSVLDEPSIDLECIVVDDASSDATGRVLERMAAGDGRLRIRTQPVNDGVSEARNVGLDVARGAWLAFVDADDWLTPGALGALMGAAQRDGVRAVIAQRVWTDGTRDWLSRAYDHAEIRTPGRRSLVDSPGLVNYLSVTGKLFHRSLADGLRFHGRVLGDQPWCLVALLRAGPGIEVVGDVVYVWSRPPAGSDRQTITTSKRRSVASAVEAVTMATEALGVAVSAATDLVEEPGRRRALVAAYCERLIGNDVGRLVQADPASGEADLAPLYEAVGTFLEAVPAEILATSERVVASIVVPPFARFHRIGPAGRAAHRRIVAIVLSARLARTSGAGGRIRAMLGFGGAAALAVARQVIRHAWRGLLRRAGRSRR